MNNKLSVLITVLFVFFALPAMSQKMLLVKKNGTKYNAKYFVGNTISFKYCDGGVCAKIEGRINAIDEEKILVGYTSEYEISKISKIYVERRAVRIAQPIVGGAGLFYLGFTGINALISKDNRVEMSTADYVIPAAMITAAVAVTPWNKRTYNLDKSDKYSLLVLDFSN